MTDFNKALFNTETLKGHASQSVTADFQQDGVAVVLRTF
jgi:hypothetical protein